MVLSWPNSYPTTRRLTARPKGVHSGNGQKDAGLGNEQMAIASDRPGEALGLRRGIAAFGARRVIVGEKTTGISAILASTQNGDASPQS
ncbi:MAG TPA: hypothetical protein VIM57_00995 [Luteolibacter sp.]